MKKVDKRRNTLGIYHWLGGYALVLSGVFIICTAKFGVVPTLWGFGLVLLICLVAFLFLWVQDERRWKREVAEPGKSTSTRSLPHSPFLPLRRRSPLS